MQKIIEYGIVNLSIDEAKSTVEKKLGVFFHQRDNSEFLYYCYTNKAHGIEMQLIPNHYTDEDGDAWMNEDRKDFTCLLEVIENHDDKIEACLKQCNNIVFVRKNA